MDPELQTKPVSQSRQVQADVPPTFFESIFDLAKMFVIALVIIIPLRYLVFSPFVIKGESMEPNFRDGEYLIIDEFSYLLHVPKRGDVVVFKYPKDTSQYYIKRIIGLPGETIEIRDGEVFITNPQGKTPVDVDETVYLDKNINTSGDLIVTLGAREYFVMGDNRSASSDSRSWGVLDRKYIVGRSWIRALPFDRWAVFSTPPYSTVSN